MNMHLATLLPSEWEYLLDALRRDVQANRLHAASYTSNRDHYESNVRRSIRLLEALDPSAAKEVNMVRVTKR